MRRSMILPAGLVVLLGGCSLAGASGGAPVPEAAGSSHPGSVVSRQDIQDSGARTVWQALRLTTNLKLDQDSDGHPSGLLYRGHSSISLDDTPAIVVDGALLSNLYTLDQMPADELESIQVWSPSEAPIRFASVASSGLIEIRTRSP